MLQNVACYTDSVPQRVLLCLLPFGKKASYNTVYQQLRLADCLLNVIDLFIYLSIYFYHFFSTQPASMSVLENKIQQKKCY